jgi:hypothetical protein
VSLPSNLQGPYRCEYEGDKLDYDATMKILESSTSNMAAGDGSLAAIRRSASIVTVNQQPSIAAAEPAILLIARIQRRQENLAGQLRTDGPAAQAGTAAPPLLVPESE